MAEPGTTPPPQTRSNSSRPVASRGGEGVSEVRPSKFSPRALAERAGLSAPGGLDWLSSTRLFQALHAEHWPDHREWTAPQVWQT